MAVYDQHYTPRAVAQVLVDRVRLKRVTTVADFAAGKGALLEAAAGRWQKATMIANDIDRRMARRLRRTFPTGQISSVDFLDDLALRRSSLLSHRGACDLVLLNPPFSCRGAGRVVLNLGEHAVACSPAMAFLLRGVTFLRWRGEVLTLLPEGCLDSNKDSEARGVVDSLGSVEVLDRFDRGSFEGCMQRTVLVRVRRDAARGRSGASAWAYGPGVCRRTPAVIVRGSLQMHDRYRFGSPDGIPLVHSTHLKGGALQIDQREAVCIDRSLLVGPAVLLPRVGTPSPQKLCVLPAGVEVALSDCVIGVKFTSDGDAKRVRTALTNGHWSAFAGAYSGSCARFITVDRLMRSLAEVGVCAAFEGRGSQANNVWT